MTTPDPDREGAEGDAAGTPDPEPRAPLDVDTTFAAIVAHWADEDDHVSPPWPEQENLSQPRGTVARDSGGPGGTAGPGGAGPGPGTSATGASSGPGTSGSGPGPGGRPTGSTDNPETPAGEPRVIRPAMPDPFTVSPSHAEASLGDRFVPPEPPPLPRGDLFGRLAWAGVLGGPVFLLVAAMVWREAPQGLILTAVGAFIGGFVALVVRLPEHHDDDDDDGAIV